MAGLFCPPHGSPVFVRRHNARSSQNNHIFCIPCEEGRKGLVFELSFSFPPLLSIFATSNPVRLIHLSAQSCHRSLVRSFNFLQAQPGCRIAVRLVKLVSGRTDRKEHPSRLWPSLPERKERKAIRRMLFPIDNGERRKETEKELRRPAPPASGPHLALWSRR